MVGLPQPHAGLPADARLLSGAACIDYAFVTGECHRVGRVRGIGPAIAELDVEGGREARRRVPSGAEPARDVEEDLAQVGDVQQIVHRVQAKALVGQDRLAFATSTLRRISRIQRLISVQLDLLDTMSPERVNGQRDVVKNERRQSYENAPYGMAELRISELMFPKNHPYRWPVIPTNSSAALAGMLSSASLDGSSTSSTRPYSFASWAVM